jgi:hypothetical protein
MPDWAGLSMAEGKKTSKGSKYGRILMAFWPLVEPDTWSIRESAPRRLSQPESVVAEYTDEDWVAIAESIAGSTLNSRLHCSLVSAHTVVLTTEAIPSVNTTPRSVSDVREETNPCG